MESFTEHEKRADLKQLKTNLVNAICASMIAEPRFNKEDDTGAQLVLNLVEQIVRVDPEFILKLAVYVRNDLNIRSTANFLVALAANYKESAPYLKKYFKYVINLPSDWLDVAALYQMLPNRGLAGRALPTALRKAMKFKFPDFDTYQLGKYNKQGKLKRSKAKAKKTGAPPPKPESDKSTLTLKQMVRQLHIDSPVYHVMCLLGKKYPANETDFRRSGLPGVFEPAKAGTRLKLPVPETWETLLSAKGNKAETWEELIDHKKLPFMAMLRNLRNLILTGVDFKYHRWAWNKLNNEETIARSKQFPFRFFSAYEAIAVDLEKLKQEIREAKAAGAKAGQKAPPKKGKKVAKGAKPGEKGARPKKVIVPKNMPDENIIRKYREALDNAVKFATVHNVKPIRGNTVVFCSIADSMSNGCKSAKGMGSVRTLLDVGVLLGLMCKYMCEECDFRIVGEPGSHHQSHLSVELQEGTVLDNMATVLNKAKSGELNNSSFQFPYDYVEECIRERKVIDNLIVLNDTMLYPEHNAQLASILHKYRQEVNPDMMFVSVNLGSASKAMEASGDRHPNDVLISGFSDAILRYIAERGDSNQLHYIDHIDKEKGIANPPPKSIHLKRGGGLSFGSSNYSNPFRSRIRAKPFSLSGRKSFLFDEDDEANDAELKAAREEEARRKKAEEEAEEREVEARERQRVREQAQKVRSGKWRAVRVFVSSTFRDMHGERDYLVRSVFPELRERCRRRRLHFYDVDLRWGVTQEEAETEGALHICLNEIDRCRPFFVGLLGERYGWRPSSYVLPEEPRYMWAKKYPQDRSITELEMYYGALRCPDASESFFYFRDPFFMSSITDESIKCDFMPEDNAAQERLKGLKKEIRATFANRCKNYTCGWAGTVGGKPMVNNLEAFGKAVLADLWQGICRTFPEDLSPLGDENRLSVARESHEEYAISRTRVFVGREDLIKTMTNFVDGDQNGPLVIVGEPGSGKSALVAQFARIYVEKNTEALVIAHYVGAATEARNIRHALLRIALELKEKLSLPDEIPEDEKELRQVFGSLLESAGFAAGGRKVVVLIDGLNQLDAKEKTQVFDWLPGSTRVRLMVSTHAETPSHHALRHRKPQPPEITVGPLEENHRKSLVRAVLAEYRKKLDEAPGNNQMRVLLRKPESHKPLYLVLACEELRLFGVYEQLSNRIKSLGGTVPKLFDELLHRLESDHDKETLKLTLSLLVAARAGLLENELLTILAREKKKEVELPRAMWAPIFAALQPFFRPVGPSGEDALSFFHGQMEFSVRKRYLSARNNEQRIHKQLAHYFLQRARVPSPAGDGWQWVDDRRAISELPHHMAKAQMWEELESVLCDLAFVKLKCTLGMAFDLISDYNEALATDYRWDGRARLEEFQSFFASNAHILGHFPDLALQQAANQPDASAPAQAAAALLGNGVGDGWVRWLNKPQGQSACKLTLASERDPVLACAFSPDGKNLVLASRDGSLRICDAATGAETATLLGHTNWVVACAYSYDGSRIVSASWDGTLKIWDSRAGVEIATLVGHTRRVNACAYSNDAQRIASASWDCTVRLWDGYSGTLLKTFNGHTKPVNAVAFSPDGKQLVSASWDSTIKLWDIEKGTEIRTFSGHSKSVRSVSFSPTGAQIVSTSVDTTVRVWDARSGEVVTTLEGHSKAVNACAFSPDGRHLVSASDDQTVKVWDALGGREITKLALADVSLNACDISPDGRRIVAAVADCTSAVWDVLSGELLFRLKGHTRTVNSVVFSPNGSYIASASDDGSLKLWSVRDGSLVRTLSGHRDCVNDVCFSPSGDLIVTASDDFTLRIWNVESGTQQREITGHTNRVTGCAWSPDGKRLASSSRDNTLRIWSPETGELKKVFKGHMDWLTRCAFSADGKRVVSCSWDYNMKLWDVRAGNEIATLRGHMGAVSAAAFSAEGKYLVSASLDGTLKIWDPVKAHEVTSLRDHSGRVTCVRFAKNGTTFVSSSEDGTVRLWDAEAGQEITTLQGHADAIRQVKYCPENDQIVSASDDCTVKVWNTSTQREIAGHSQWVTACSLAPSAKLLATSSRDGSIKLWDTRTHKPRAAIEGHDQPVNCVAVSPDGSLVVSASDDFTVKVWDGTNGDLLRTIRHHTNSVRWVCFSPNGSRLASASWDNTVCVCDPQRGSLQLTLRGHKDWVNACVFSPDGTRIATASHDRTVVLWDASTGSIVHSFSGVEANWVALAFSPDGKYLASATYDGTVVLTDVSRRTARTFHPHAKRISALAFTADGAHLLSAAHDNSITAHRITDILKVSGPAPSGRFFTKAPATALCSAASLSAAGDSLGNVYQLRFEF